MKKLLIVASLFALLISCKAPEIILTPYEVIPITEKPETIHSTGMFYALPRQSVEVDITIRKQEFIKGPYAEFAERLLGVTNFIKENNTIYSIDDVFVSQKSEVDPKQIYFVQFNDSKLALKYDNNLIIRGVNLSKTEPSGFRKKDSERQIVQASQAANRPIIPTFNTFERKDTVFFNQMVDTQLVQRFEIRTVQTVKTPLQKAQEIVESIAKIREDRNRLLTGFQEVNYEAAAIQYMNEEFNRMEDEYISLFTGTTKSSFETVRFEFLPEDKDNLTVKLAGFLPDHGLVNVELEEDVPDVKIITLNIALQDDILSGIQQFSKNIRLPRRGFFYNIPSPALVTVKFDNQLLFSKPMPFSQFGTTQSLAPDFLQIDFSPQTGEIRSVRAIGN